jgi:hypothetical protein
MSDTQRFTDWLLEMPFKVFFWGMTAVLFVFWCIAMLVVLAIMWFVNR